MKALTVLLVLACFASLNAQTKYPVGEARVAGRGALEILRMLGAKRVEGATDRQLSSYARAFAGTDRNRDGRHSRKEYIENGRYMSARARRGIFGAADNNGDDFVTKVEYVLNRTITDEAKAIVQRADADKNGRVTRAEFVKGSPIKDKTLAGAVYDALDTSGDGVITFPEYLRVWGVWARPNYKVQEVALANRLAQLSNVGNTAGGRPGIEQMFEIMDRNKDGKLSRAEFRGPPHVFTSADKDKDGAVTRAEMEAFRSRTGRGQSIDVPSPRPPIRTTRKPNFVLIYCDDLGYGDIGCFGSTKHRTPHIDSIATDGIRLTDFYVTSGVCTPSRSSLMTGCYPRRVNMHEDARNGWVLFPVAKKGLNPSEITIAEVLKEAGYVTAAVGKWHLGDQPQFLPTRQGFDSYFGIPYSNDMGGRKNSKRPPLPLMRHETVIEAPVAQPPLTGRYTAEAIRFITENQKKPFFLYLPHTFPHLPIHASKNFLGKSANGKFGDSVEEIDWSTGQILATLKKLGLEENTLVVFTSDNGAARRAGGSNAPLRGHKGSVWEGGMRVSCAMRWPGVIPAGTTSNEIVSTLDILPTFAHFAGAKVPTDRIIDGMDCHAVLTTRPDPDGKQARSPRDTFFYYFRDQLCAVRWQNWKLHLAQTTGRGGRKFLEDILLYDLSTDIAESKNVATDHPDIVAKLQKLADACRIDLGDRKKPGKNQRPAGNEPNPKPLVLTRQP